MDGSRHSRYRRSKKTKKKTGEKEKPFGKFRLRQHIYGILGQSIAELLHFKFFMNNEPIKGAYECLRIYFEAIAYELWLLRACIYKFRRTI